MAQLYDLDSGWSADRDFYLERAGLKQKRILDLGCGTGLLCDAYAARGHLVTGVDPAAAMLDIARRKPNGPAIEWVQATAQNFSSVARYDLIIMTGNAFQTLHDDAAVKAACTNMARQLARGGEIVFESRNPAIDWSSRWDGETVLKLGAETVTETHRVVGFDGTHMQMDSHYRFPDREMVSHNQLLFLSRAAIVAHLEQVGLQVSAVLGDWDGTEFDPLIADEMVFVANHPA